MPFRSTLFRMHTYVSCTRRLTLYLAAQVGELRPPEWPIELSVLHVVSFPVYASICMLCILPRIHTYISPFMHTNTCLQKEQPYRVSPHLLWGFPQVKSRICTCFSDSQIIYLIRYFMHSRCNLVSPQLLFHPLTSVRLPSR
jgi:hypothetical protein